jgi:hypothetical protein
MVGVGGGGGGGGGGSSSSSTGSTVVVVVVVVVSVAAVFYTHEAFHLWTNSVYVIGLLHHHPSQVRP